MDQILHIFKKDARRHWPEILISLALLALYTNRALHPWANLSDPYRLSRSFYFFVATGQYIAPALVIFWLFMVIRVVQDESLVGNRQWWITKPYVWWQLLFAKLLFVVIFICVPVLHVQLLVLDFLKFPVLRNLGALFWMQLSLLLVVTCLCVLLASLTKNLAQLLLVVGAAVLVLIAALMWSSQSSYSSAMEETPSLIDRSSDLLVWGSLAGAVAGQFARRRRWAVIGALVVLIGFAAAVETAFTSSRVALRRYTQIDRSAAPLQIAIKPIQPSNEDKDFSRDSSHEVQLKIPLTVTGVAAGTVIELNGINIYGELLGKSTYSGSWLHDYQQFWPEDQEKILSYWVDRKDYQKLKDAPLRVHVELALSEYQFGDPRNLRIASQRFSDPALGSCRISPLDRSQIHCLYPAHIPDYVLRFDPQQSGCVDDHNEERAQADTVSYAWKSGNEMGFPDPELSPISGYDVWFTSVSLASHPEDNKFRVVRLCPGTVLTLARPVLQRQFRVQLEPFDTRLEDLAIAPLRFSYREPCRVPWC